MTWKEIAKEAVLLLELWDKQLWDGPGARTRDPDLVALEQDIKTLEAEEI